MRKIKFVKENYIGNDLRQYAVSYTDEFGRGLACYTPDNVPKYVLKFIEKREKELFSNEYDKKEFDLTVYIYRK